jgi:hypothetical protein
MPIMAANAQSDARSAAWLLASAARDSISASEGASEWRDALNNTYRLLEAFRKNLLLGVRTTRFRGHRIPNDLEMLTVLPSSERHLLQVRKAMELALAKSFAETPKDQAVDTIETVLRSVLAPEEYKASVEDKQKATEFFNELLKRLAQP